MIAITGISVLTNVVADIALIPHYGTVGAGIAKLIALLVMFFGYAFALKGWMPITKLFKNLTPPFIIAAILAPLVWYLRDFVPFYINGIIYCGLCLTAFIIFKMIKIKDIKVFGGM